MKKLFLVLTLLLGLVLLVACGPEETPEDTTYTVTFNSAGGSAVPSQTVEEGGKATEPTAPTRTGYNFQYWYLDNQNVPFNFNTVITADITLTAYWTAQQVENNGALIDFSNLFVPKSPIRVWIDDQAGEYMAEIIQEFNKIYPNIVVEHQHMGTVDARERLKTFGPSGNGADVFQFPHDHLAQAILEDLVYALPTDVAENIAERAHPLGLDIATLWYDETAKSFDPSSPNAQEKLFAVPMSLESVGLYYNKAYVQTPATTYEQLLADADTWNAQLASDESGQTNAQKGWYYLGNSSHWADSYFMQHIYSAFDFYPFGPTLDNPNEVGFAALGVENGALEWIVEELKPRVTGTGAHNSVGGSTNFENGNIPYVIAGPWMNKTYQDKGINFGIAPLPTIKGKATRTFAGAQMAAVYKYSKNTADAIKFVEFLASDKAMEIQYRHMTKLPALQQELLYDIPGVMEDPLMLAMSNQLETSVPMPTIPEVTYYWGPGETMITQVWNDAVLPSVAVVTAEESYQSRKAGAS